MNGIAKIIVLGFCLSSLVCAQIPHAPNAVEQKETPNKTDGKQAEKAESKASAEAKSSSEKSETNSDPKSKSDAKPKADAQSKPDTLPKAHAKSNADAKPKSDGKPKTDAKPKSDGKPKTDTKPKANTKPKSDAKPKSEAKSNAPITKTQGAATQKNQPARKEKLRVVTTLSVIAEITKEIGGDLVDVNALSSASEDPHFVKAKPTFKRLVGQADLFLQIGRSLELWVPLVIASAANQKLAGSGLVEVSKGFKALEIPSKLSRDAGDIHPQGNPHVWLSPLGGLKMAENIKNALSTKDPANKATFEKNFESFKQKLAKALFGEDLVKSAGSVDFLLRQHESKQLKDYVAKRNKPLGGFVKLAESIDYQFMTYHTVFTYLADEFSLKVFSSIEEKSGVEPSLKYQQKLIAEAKAANVKHIIVASYYVGMGKLIDRITNEIGGKRMYVDVDCRPGESYIAMMSRLLNAFVAFKPLPPATKSAK